jgi:hypothetical protein
MQIRTRNIQLSSVGQLFILVDQAAIVTDSPTNVASAVTVDLDGDPALLVFRGAENAKKCQQRLNKPGHTVVTFQHPRQFVGLLESAMRNGVQLVALDYLPAEASEVEIVDAFAIQDFVQFLRAHFKIGDQPCAIEDITYRTRDDDA